MLPELRTEIPGPRSRQLAARLRQVESRNVTLVTEGWPVFWERAEGVNVWDADGNRFLDFTAGAVASIITSFDVWHSTLPWLEIYGSEGTMLVPDPNNFSGSVKVRRAGAEQWSDMPLTHSFAENSRGLGVLDMAVAIQEGRAHRASGDLAYHVLDIMHAIHDASNENRHIHLTSGVERPAPMPLGMDSKGF